MSKISCRKCNGQHLTIKCSKNNNESKIQHNQTKHHKNNITNSNDKKFNKFNKFNKFIRKTSVKIENLPSDITTDELNFLIKEWGCVDKINLNYRLPKIAYVDFLEHDDAIWFIDAIDRTPFDRNILHVSLNKK